MNALQIFHEEVSKLQAPRVLELGAHRSQPDRSTLHKEWVPHASQYIGTDIFPGEDVDLIADVHQLSQIVGCASFNVIISCASFEHFKYPQLAAHEILKSLAVDGLLFVQTHQTFPLHSYPYDYFRFSIEALAALFGTKMGFETLATGYDYPAQIHSERVPDSKLFPAWLNCSLVGRKLAATPEEYIFEL